MSQAIESDCKLIDRLGGSAKVAVLLGFSRYGGTQRVDNWKRRGIPSHIKVKHPELFMTQAPAHQARVAINSEARQVAQGVV